MGCFVSRSVYVCVYSLVVWRARVCVCVFIGRLEGTCVCVFIGHLEGTCVCESHCGDQRYRSGPFPWEQSDGAAVWSPQQLQT